MKLEHIATLEARIEELHGAHAEFLNAKSVTELDQGHPVWTGLVYTFVLRGHPTASKCYGLVGTMFGNTQEVATVLGEPPIATSGDAVRAYIFEHRRA